MKFPSISSSMNLCASSTLPQKVCKIAAISSLVVVELIRCSFTVKAELVDIPSPSIKITIISRSGVEKRITINFLTLWWIEGASTLK
ncbi:hypothetical protein DFA_12134 [Cavenderia fasciculata]|uniref:Uncharacterized protein n=1 Tax=Cavenderia fasciculata TaxID=261658 RepID=F4QC81_CACFS|nr:uncharacterized protein DFA_12134 [Cavenderia fasciculata]EGG14362.1 hypothetical protein DFA_12134 [Cavenderia fasciculata]|eukprot:XP_004351086.1 hypothetical protein DFA_12134 [Cavenderia fasciculata]